MSELALQRIHEAKQHRLTRLDLGNCGLTELPDELFELTWLSALSLNYRPKILLNYLKKVLNFVIKFRLWTIQYFKNTIICL